MLFNFVKLPFQLVMMFQPVRFANYNDDFFEMVSRLQSKRLNDQRCDPIILSDLTNHSKNVTRQSDTIACDLG